MVGVVWSGAPFADAAATAAQAGERVDPLRQRLEEARARLNLTDKQVDQVRPILRAGFDAMLEVLEEHGIDIGNRSGSGRRDSGSASFAVSSEISTPWASRRSRTSAPC